jgi:hypothetical protein
MENQLTTKDIIKQNEIWLPVRGYKGFYEVSSFGLVRSVTRKVKRSRGGLQLLKGRVLKSCLVKGYKTVVLSKLGKTKRFYVHDLVAQSYIPKPKGLVIDHINRNCIDNRISNLRYCTYRENANNTSRDNVTGFVGVSLNDDRYSKRYRSRIRVNGKMVELGSYKTPEEASRAYLTKKKELENGK